jgi:hypothetical protein
MKIADDFIQFEIARFKHFILPKTDVVCVVPIGDGETMTYETELMVTADEVPEFDDTLAGASDDQP